MRFFIIILIILIALILMDDLGMIKCDFFKRANCDIILQQPTYVEKMDNFYDNNKNTNEKYTAVIIEPRQHPALEFVLNNFLKNLDDNWNFIIFHGNLNIDYINKIIDEKLSQYKHRIKLINLNVDNLTINDYNLLLKNKNFYNDIPTETFLIFQTDSMICPKYFDRINEFLKYDYVGAPWPNNEVGNGGLSLRKKSKMLEIIDNCIEPNGINEDVYFSSRCDQLINIYKPDFEKAKLFSTELVLSENGSWGVHKAYDFHDLDLLETQCEGIKELTRLNKTKSN